MQSASSRNWTRVVVSISYNDMCMCVCVCVLLKQASQGIGL